MAAPKDRANDSARMPKLATAEEEGIRNYRMGDGAKPKTVKFDANNPFHTKILEQQSEGINTNFPFRGAPKKSAPEKPTPAPAPSLSEPGSYGEGKRKGPRKPTPVFVKERKPKGRKKETKPRNREYEGAFIDTPAAPEAPGFSSLAAKEAWKKRNGLA